MSNYRANVLGKEINIRYITNAEEAIEALVPFFNERVIGFDTETTGLDPLSGCNWRLVQFAKEDGDTIVLDMRKIGKAVIPTIVKLLEAPRPVKVGHNLKFDIKFCRTETNLREFGGIFDTMIAAQILSFGDPYQRVGLDSCLVRYLNESVSKDEQTSDWSRDELSESQIIYAGVDANVVLNLRNAMMPLIYESGTVETCKLEFGAIDAIAAMEINGFYLDTSRWMEQIASSVENEASSKNALFELAAPAFNQGTLWDGAPLFNPRSPKQLIECLGRLGVPLPEDNGKVTTRGWRLKYLVNDYPIIGALLDFREWSKRLGTYGPGYLNFINPTTGRVHADFRQIGALTGRMSVNKPNLQQLPHIDEFRRCFIPQNPNNRLVVADYSAIELRILADYSQEPNFVNAFMNGEDLHTLTGCRLFNVTPDQLTKAQRNFAKTINFGIAYGMGRQTLAIRTGESEEYSQRALNNYRRQNEVLCNWLDEVARQTIEMREVRTYSGRLAKFNFDPRDRKAVGDVERNGKNTPPQGGCADIVKLALGYLHHELYRPENCWENGQPKAKLVNVVHDEIVLESDANFADQAGTILSDCMVRAGEYFVKTIPIIADYEVLNEWIKH